MNNVIEATILKYNLGKYEDEDVLISNMTFDFKRLQFPVRLAFAMSINKSQGQLTSVTEPTKYRLQWRVELIFGEEQKYIYHKIPFIHPNGIFTTTKHLQFKKYTYVRLICIIRCTYLFNYLVNLLNSLIILYLDLCSLCEF
jgi:hypothetical protein